MNSKLETLNQICIDNNVYPEMTMSSTFSGITMARLKAPYSSKIDILLSKKGLINWHMVLIQSLNVAPDSL